MARSFSNNIFPEAIIFKYCEADNYFLSSETAYLSLHFQGQIHLRLTTLNE
jgi:hypothetical protein